MTATPVEFEGAPAVKIEIVVPVDQVMDLLDLVVAAALAAKGLTE